ncbi:MAG: exonuclease domain-containing protein [Clostridia bacterium]|nr:exonuclease domain-containing protein [Clostridia bacterium]
MNYIVFDMEWNQPYSKETAIQSPIYLSGEIIQIGAIKLNAKAEAIDCLDLMIAPTFYRKLHHRIKKMTGITQEDLRGKKHFREAIEEFREWCGKDCIFLTWGYDDIQQLKDNLLMHDMDEDWLPPCLNLQGIFNHQISHENRQFSLEYAMEQLGIIPALQAHNAFNDAIYTARVAKCLDLKKGVRNYKELNGVLWYSMHSIKEFFPCFRNREKALNDPQLKKIPCPVCGKTLTVKEFIPVDEKNLTAEIRTPHGLLSVKLRVMQNQRRSFYIKRTIRFL